ESPSPPVAGCRPASARPRPVLTEQVTPSPSPPSADSVTLAASGSSVYELFSGAWRSRRALLSIVNLQSVHARRRPVSLTLDAVHAAASLRSTDVLTPSAARLGSSPADRFAAATWCRSSPRWPRRPRRRRGAGRVRPAVPTRRLRRGTSAPAYRPVR